MHVTEGLFMLLPARKGVEMKHPAVDLTLPHPDKALYILHEAQAAMKIGSALTHGGNPAPGTRLHGVPLSQSKGAAQAS